MDKNLLIDQDNNPNDISKYEHGKWRDDNIYVIPYYNDKNQYEIKIELLDTSNDELNYIKKFLTSINGTLSDNGETPKKFKIMSGILFFIGAVILLFLLYISVFVCIICSFNLFVVIILLISMIRKLIDFFIYIYFSFKKNCKIKEIDGIIKKENEAQRMKINKNEIEFYKFEIEKSSLWLKITRNAKS